MNEIPYSAQCTSIKIYTCINVYVYIYVNIKYMYIYMYICIYMHIYMYIYVYIYVYIYISICIYICTHNVHEGISLDIYIYRTQILPRSSNMNVNSSIVPFNFRGSASHSLHLTIQNGAQVNNEWKSSDGGLCKLGLVSLWVFFYRNKHKHLTDHWP